MLWKTMVYLNLTYILLYHQDIKSLDGLLDSKQYKAIFMMWWMHEIYLFELQIDAILSANDSRSYEHYLSMQ